MSRSQVVLIILLAIPLSWLGQKMFTALIVPTPSPEALENSIQSLDYSDMRTLSTDTIKYYLDQLGYRRTLAALHTADPSLCHDTAHIIGDLAYLQTGSIPKSLSLCTEQCMSGCIHGAILSSVGNHVSIEGSKAGHVELTDFSDQIAEICSNSTVSDTLEGTCIHGIGHAVMSLSDSTEEGLTLCEAFTDERKRYYCQTGVYMELIDNHHVVHSTDNEVSELSPCSPERPNQSACMRYQTAAIAARFPERDMKEYCNSLANEQLSRACYHGLGRLWFTDITTGKRSINDCLSTDSAASRICVEAAAELIGELPTNSYEPVCIDLSDPELQHVCTTAIDRGLYSFEKDFSPYLTQK